MKCELIIDSPLLTKNDIILLNKGEKEIQFLKIETHNLFPPEIMLILIQLAENIGYSVIYDIIKYALCKLKALLTEKKTKQPSRIKIEIVCGRQKCSIACNFELTENQKDKLLDAAIKKLMEKK